MDTLERLRKKEEGEKCVKCGEYFNPEDGVIYRLVYEYFGKGGFVEKLAWCRKCWLGDPSKARFRIGVEWR